MFGIAGQMEIARGKVAGYYIERKAILNNPTIDNMNLDQLYQRMRDIRKRNRFMDGKREAMKNLNTIKNLNKKEDKKNGEK